MEKMFSLFRIAPANKQMAHSITCQVSFEHFSRQLPTKPSHMVLRNKQPPAVYFRTKTYLFFVFVAGHYRKEHLHEMLVL